VRALTVRCLGVDPALSDRSAPESGPGETLLDVVAAPLNPVDLRVASGAFWNGEHPPIPYVPGVEAVGEVRKSDRFAAGSLVWTLLGGLGMARDGALAEMTVVKDECLVAIPKTVDPALAAGIGTSGLAAWIPMTRTVPIRTSDTVVILGATGAVGQVAIQVAKLLGAGTVIGVGRSEQRLERALGLGADAAVVLRDPDQLARDLGEACSPAGATYVFDLMWGEPLVAALEITASHARVVHVGHAAGPIAMSPGDPIRRKSLEIVGFSVFNVAQEALHASYLELLHHVQEGRIDFASERITLAESEHAWQRLKSGQGTKFVVCP